MRFFYGLLVFLFFMTGPAAVSGQASTDTLGLEGAVVDTVVARRLFNEALELINSGKYQSGYLRADSAEHIYRRALGDGSTLVADVMHQKGRAKHMLRKFDAAIELYQSALQIREKNLPAMHPNIGSLHYNLGLSYQEKGVYEKAIDHYQKSIEIRRESLGPDNLDLAWSYNNLGNTLSKTRELNQAIEMHNKAFAIRQKSMGENHYLVAHSHINIGVVYKEKGDLKKSTEHYTAALNIIRTHPENKSDLPTLFNNLGNAYADLGNQEKAISFYEKALQIRLKFLKPDHPDIAQSYNNLGIAYRKEGLYEKAIEALQKSMAIREKIYGDEDQSLIQSYNNLGNVYSDKTEYDKALLCFEKALSIATNSLGPENFIIARINNNIGGVYAHKRQYEAAYLAFSNSLAVLSKAYGETDPALAESYNNIGLTFTDRKKHEEAIGFYQKALNAQKFTGRIEPNTPGNIQELIISLHRLSRSYDWIYKQSNEASDLAKAEQHALQALAALDYQQASFSEDGTKSFWLTQNFPIYEQAIAVSLLKASADNNHSPRRNTFAYAEKSKAALLQAQLKAADAIAFAGIPDSLLQQEYNLRIDITWREKQRQGLLDKGLAETDTNVLHISGILFDLKQQYETLKHRFETDYREYFRLKYKPAAASLHWVQDTLLSPNQTLLEYFAGDSSLFLFVVRPDTFHVQEVPLDFPLADWIEQFRQGLYGYYAADRATQNEALKKKSLAQYLEFAPKLYQKIFAPIEKWLPEQGAILLVPDGPLGYIPFDALLTGPPQDKLEFKAYPYLLRKYQFSYSYSATLLQEMRNKKHRQPPARDFVAFAPFYTGDTLLFGNGFETRTIKGFTPLPFSKTEVDSLHQIMGGDVVAGTFATEARFAELAGQYRILHLATHGVADNRVGEYAFLAFSEINDSTENELLYVKDLYNLQLNADLVVLSACETGVGKLQRGEGIISLARAFAYAGAKSIVTTLWEVSDQSTSELMRFFYRQLKTGKPKDEALREARRQYLDQASARNCHPFFWAAFVPLGDMRPLR